MQTFATRRGAKETPWQIASSRSSSHSKFGSASLLLRNPAGRLALISANGEIDRHHCIARDQSTLFDFPEREFSRATADRPLLRYDDGRMQSAEGRTVGRAPIDIEQICRYEFGEPAYHQHIADGTAVPRGVEAQRSALLRGDECRARLARPELVKSIGLYAEVVFADGPFRPFEAARNGPAGRHWPGSQKAEEKSSKILILRLEICVYGLFILCVLAHLQVSFLLEKERRLKRSRGRHPNAHARAWVVRHWIVIDDL